MLTDYPNGVSSFGMPVLGGGMVSQGKVIFVKPYSGTDGADGSSPDQAVKTLAHAKTLATANSNDVVYLFAESNTASHTTDYQSTVLDWNKDGVHLIGANGGAFMGQRSRISNLSTATAIVNGLVIVSANNCLIANIEIYQGQGGTNPTGASIALVVSGMRNHFNNCQISGIGHTELDDATSRSLSVTGAENFFKHCYIGLDTTIRATATSEVDCANARNVFEDCVIESYTSLSTFKALTVTASTVGRFVMLKNCLLSAVQNITSAVAPTGAVIHGAIAGCTYVMGSVVAGYAAVSTLDDANIFLNGPVGGTATAGLATAVDAA